MFFPIIFVFIIIKVYVFIYFFSSLIGLFFLFVVIFLILCVAVMTLLERKFFASIQRRRGPNAIGIFGILQPIADAIKLLAKESVIPSSSNYLIFIFSPISIFIFSLLC